MVEKFRAAVPSLESWLDTSGWAAGWVPLITESNRLALAWIEDNLGPLVVGQATATAGPVIVHSLP